jgi:hypothetical protein
LREGEVDNFADFVIVQAFFEGDHALGHPSSLSDTRESRDAVRRVMARRWLRERKTR